MIIFRGAIVSLDDCRFEKRGERGEGRKGEEGRGEEERRRGSGGCVIYQANREYSCA